MDRIISQLSLARVRYLVYAFLIACGFFVAHVYETRAINIITFKDTISTSAPDEYANHNIEFVTEVAIPPGGYVRVRPHPGSFDIPVGTFVERNVELYVNGSLRDATTTPDATYDGISITPGASGNVTITLNSTTGIAAGAELQVLLGTNTTFASTTTDTGIMNPSALGTYPVFIEIGGAEAGSARALVAIVDQVAVAPVDTREFIPPIRSNGAPTGELSGTVLAVQMTLETDEFATCKYSTVAGTEYDDMPTTFTSTGSVFHSILVAGLVNETTYTFYIRCEDDEGNQNTDDYEIEFTIPAAPEGEPGDGEDGNDGDDDGTGTGSTGSGGGGSSGDTDSDEDGSGGSSGGGGGGGGTNSDDLPYESGDGRVIINGFAFPNSTVTVLVDGSVAETTTSNSSGVFTVTIDEIARAVYTFGIYATDPRNVRSTTFTTTFTVTGSRGSTLSNVHLMPTVSVTPARVEPGQPVTFSGYAIPNSTISIETQREGGSSASASKLTTTSGANGAWTTTFATAGLARDTWKVRARSTNIDGTATNFSNYTFYGIGADAAEPTSTSDLNRDGRVNLVDFSILLFHWNTSGGNSNPPADINRDGRVSLTDFSIMIFNWTG